MKSTTRRTLLGLPLPLFLASREAQADSTHRPTFTASVWNRTELYFGTSREMAPPVTDAQFRAFIDAQVTPRFPDGLTLLTGYGQFRNSNNVIQKETSYELILFYPPQMKDANKLIEEIRTVYKSMFQQESVLRSDSINLISF